MRCSFKALSILGLILLWISGCSTADLREEFMQKFTQGDYNAAAIVTGGDSGTDYDRDDLLLTLYTGSALRADGRFKDSIIAFNTAEQHLLWQADGTSLLDYTIASTISEAWTSYSGWIYEGILINTFKALTYLQLGDIDQARVEFNRADVRQENAIRQLSSAVEALQPSDDEQQTYSERIHQTYLTISPYLEERLEAIRQIGQYRDLRNPLTDWLHGIFRLATGDPNRASNLLRNAVVLNERQNPYLIQDFTDAEQQARFLTPTQLGRVWVIYEDGIGPSFKEWRRDLFLNIGTGVPLHIGIALPEFVPGQPAYGGITLSADAQTYTTSPLLNLDQLVATEFGTGYDALVARVISTAVIKASLQIASDIPQDEDTGDSIILSIIRVLTRLFSVTTTSADVRSWEALPHTVSIARLSRPQNGQLSIITAQGQESHTITLPGSQSADVILLVKAVTQNVPIVYYVTSFPAPFEQGLPYAY